MNWLYHRTTDDLPEHLQSRARIAALAVETRDKTLRQLIEIDALVRRSGATFVHVLQPHLYSGKMRPEAAPLTGNYFLTPKGLEPSLRAGYAGLVQMTPDLRRAGVRAHDAIDTFDSISEPLFLDWVHVNHRANAAVAERLFEILAAEGLVERR